MLTCEKCGKQFIRYKSMIKPGITHFFCSRACAKEHLSAKMTKMNEDLNPTRMDNFWNMLAVREGHLRNNTGKEHSYPKIFGRPLKKGEVVPHKDGNPRNNLIDNLEVLSSQVEHAKLHCKNGRFS